MAISLYSYFRQKDKCRIPTMTVDCRDKLACHLQSYLPVASAKSGGVAFGNIIAEIYNYRFLCQFHELFHWHSYTFQTSGQSRKWFRNFIFREHKSTGFKRYNTLHFGITHCRHPTWKPSGGVRHQHLISDFLCHGIKCRDIKLMIAQIRHHLTEEVADAERIFEKLYAFIPFRPYTHAPDVKPKHLVGNRLNRYCRA